MGAVAGGGLGVVGRCARAVVVAGLVAVVSALGGCQAPSARLVTAEDFASGRVLAAAGGSDLGFANMTSEELLLDDRLLQFQKGDRWEPCIPKGEWQDSKWGIPLARGGAVSQWAPDGVWISCPVDAALRYGDVGIVAADGSSPPVPVPTGWPVPGPTRVAAAVGPASWCLVELTDHGRTFRRVFTQGRPVVQVAEGQLLRSVGCTFDREADVPATMRSTVEPGVWTAGVDFPEGRYSPEDSLCQMDVRAEGAFGPAVEAQPGARRLEAGQVISTDCRWSRQPAHAT